MKRILLAIIIVYLSFTVCSCDQVQSRVVRETSENQKEKPIEETTSFNIQNASKYEDKKFKFSVKYPTDWKVKIEPQYKATEDHEGSPDGGINIFVESDEENKIYVFRQWGNIGIQGLEEYTSESFETTSGMSGYKYIREHNEKTELILLFKKEHVGAILNVKTVDYKKNENIILSILKSIEVTQ